MVHVTETIKHQQINDWNHQIKSTKSLFSRHACFDTDVSEWTRSKCLQKEMIQFIKLQPRLMKSKINGNHQTLNKSIFLAI